MKKSNKYLKISSIMYTILSIMMIQITPLFGGIFLAIGIYLLALNLLDYVELQKKKTQLIIIAIISIFINTVSAILLFLTIGEISPNKLDNNIPPPEDEISSEAKRIDILLKIGIGMILISGILIATSTWTLVSDTIKCLGLSMVGILFLGLSKVSETKLKIEKTTKAYYIIGQIFFLLTLVAIGAFGTISNWFSYTGEGKFLVYFLTFSLLSIILLLIDKKFNIKENKYLAIIISYISIYNFLLFIGLNIELIILVISVVIFITNILIPSEPNNIIREVSYSISHIFWIFVIFGYTNAQYNIINIISSAINILNLLYITKEYKDNFEHTLTNIINYILITNIVLKTSSEHINIILFTITSVYYLITNYNNKQTKNSNQIIYNMLTTIILLSMVDSPIKMFICSIIYAIINFINCYIINNEKNTFDLSYQPMILFLVVSSITKLLNTVIEINMIYNFAITTIIYAIIYSISKFDKTKKIYSIALTIITILTLLINSVGENIITSIITIVSSIYIYKIYNKSIFSYILILFSILMFTYNISIYHISEIAMNIINIIIFGILTYYYKGNNKLKRINLIALVIPLYLLVNSVGIEGEIQDILNSILLLYILFIVVTQYINNPKTKDIIATIFTSLILFNNIFTQSLLIGLYIGLVGIIITFTTYNKKEFKSFFYCGIIITILNIIIKLGKFWSQIPLPVYLLLVGILIIIFVTNKEFKKQKQPPVVIEQKKEVIQEKTIQIEKENTSTNVTNNINHKTMNFCTNCGTPNDGNNYCKKCGTTLIINNK